MKAVKESASEMVTARTLGGVRGSVRVEGGAFEKEERGSRDMAI